MKSSHKQSSSLSICPNNGLLPQGLQGGRATRWKVPVSLGQSFEESCRGKLPDKEHPCWVIIEQKTFVGPLTFGSYCYQHELTLMNAILWEITLIQHQPPYLLPGKLYLRGERTERLTEQVKIFYLFQFKNEFIELISNTQGEARRRERGWINTTLAPC